MKTKFSDVPYVQRDGPANVTVVMPAVVPSEREASLFSPRLGL